MKPGVPESEMHFGDEPTSVGDQIAHYARVWYERNRESWCARHRICNLLGTAPDRDEVHADEWMLSFVQEVARIENAVRKAAHKRESGHAN